MRLNIKLRHAKWNKMLRGDKNMKIALEDACPITGEKLIVIICPLINVKKPQSKTFLGNCAE